MGAPTKLEVEPEITTAVRTRAASSRLDSPAAGMVRPGASLRHGEPGEDIRCSPHAGHPWQNLLDRELVQTAPRARARVLGDHDLVAVLPRIARRGLYAEVRGDS